MSVTLECSDLPRPDGNTVAYATTPGRAPTVAFLGGFRSDMTGTKAHGARGVGATKTGRAFLRFDYLGHGQSSGRFEDGTIGRWLDNSLAAIDALTDGQAGAGRLEHGRLAVAAGGARTARAPGRAGADRRRAGFHRAHAAEGPVADGSRRSSSATAGWSGRRNIRPSRRSSPGS